MMKGTSGCLEICDNSVSFAHRNASGLGTNISCGVAPPTELGYNGEKAEAAGLLVIERLRACKGWVQECVIQAENGGLAQCNVGQMYDD
jgi:hypothetical protein